MLGYDNKFCALEAGIIYLNAEVAHLIPSFGKIFYHVQGFILPNTASYINHFPAFRVYAWNENCFGSLDSKMHYKLFFKESSCQSIFKLESLWIGLPIHYNKCTFRVVGPNTTGQPKSFIADH